MLLERPHAAVPTAAKATAIWFAARRPITLQSRPYSGVNVQVASRYLAPHGNAERARGKRRSIITYAVPSQLA